MNKMIFTITYVVLCIPLVYVEAAITLTGKQCGSKVCHILEYCSSFNNRCENCELVCNQTAHNFDHIICTEQCQGNSKDLL